MQKNFFYSLIRVPLALLLLLSPVGGSKIIAANPPSTNARAVSSINSDERPFVGRFVILFERGNFPTLGVCNREIMGMLYGNRGGYYYNLSGCDGCMPKSRWPGLACFARRVPSYTYGPGTRSDVSETVYDIRIYTCGTSPAPPTNKS